MSESNFRSLRVRLLLPLLAASLLAALLVAATSAWLGSQWARRTLDQKFEAVQRTVAGSSFPLTASVSRLLAELTQTEIVTFGEDGRAVETTLDLTPAQASQIFGQLQAASGRSPAAGAFAMQIGARSYLAYAFRRTNTSSPSDTGRRVLVLFDEEQVRAARLRAALLPLATGLSTILLLGTLSLVLTNRLVERLQRLQRRVEIVANGNFDCPERDPIPDEVGRLATAVDSMAAQLKDLWQAVQRQQSEKLLHQIAGGLAHQLRNTLTGARLALELHARHRSTGEDEEVIVALREIAQAEDYIRRLLLVGQGQQDRDRRAPVLECLTSVQSSLAPMAKHRRVEISWTLSEALAGQWVKDGPSLIAAVSNLVLNGIQAGEHVRVAADITAPGRLLVSVSDDGVGIPADMAAEIFEPFVTTKPEGMGLGLPLVRRAAEHLGGEVQWTRVDGRTLFNFVAQVFDANDESNEISGGTGSTTAPPDQLN